MKGIVLKSTGKIYTVLLESNEVTHCHLRGKIRLDNLRTTNPIAVGDHVILEENKAEGFQYVIADYEERSNYIVRKSTNLSKQMQILASNIDCLFLIITLKNPSTQLAFIDRYLVAAESFRIPVTILINKIDLLNEKELLALENLKKLYENVGYPCHAISANDSKSIDFLKKEINNKQVMFGGHSGVGKTTIINALDDQLRLRTGEISQAHLQGQHTTTFAEMHPIKSGGYIIDTPGIRAFGITEMDKEVISHYFPEMRKLIGECKFHNCQHLNEPKCAVKERVEVGEIAKSRYQSYIQLITEDQDEVHRKNKYELP